MNASRRVVFARLLHRIRDQLPLPASVHFAAQVWNAHFTACAYNAEQAGYAVQNMSDPYHFAYDGCLNVTKCWNTWAGRRTIWAAMHIGEVFGTVFGSNNVGIGKRIRPLYAGDGSYSPLAADALAYMNAVWGPPNQHIAALSMAPYAGLGTATNNLQNLTVDQVLDSINATVQTLKWPNETGVQPDSTNQMGGHVALAAYYGLEFRAYEGGPATTGPNYPVSLMAKANASIDPRMESIVTDHLNAWYSWGSTSVFNFFSAGATSLYAPWGTFGILYDMKVPVTPKTLAIDAVRSAPRVPTLAGLHVPTLQHNASQYMLHYGVPRRAEVTWLPINTTLQYMIQNPTTRTAAINTTVWYSAVNASALLEVSCGPLPSQSTILTLPSTGNFNSFQPISAVCDPMLPLSTSVNGGVAIIQLKALTAQSYRLMYLDFTYAV